MAILYWLMLVGYASVLAQVEPIDGGSRCFLLKHVYVVPVTLESGTVSLNLHVGARASPLDFWQPNFEPLFATVDRSVLGVTARWENLNKDRIEASVSGGWDSTHDQPIADVAFTLDSIFPDGWQPWRLRGEVRADSTGTNYEALCVSTQHDGAAGGRILTSLALRRRQYTTSASQRRENNILTTDCQWWHDERLGIGIQIKYFLESHTIESLFYLQLGPYVRTP